MKIYSGSSIFFERSSTSFNFRIKTPSEKLREKKSFVFYIKAFFYWVI